MRVADVSAKMYNPLYVRFGHVKICFLCDVCCFLCGVCFLCGLCMRLCVRLTLYAFMCASHFVFVYVCVSQHIFLAWALHEFAHASKNIDFSRDMSFLVCTLHESMCSCICAC